MILAIQLTLKMFKPEIQETVFTETTMFWVTRKQKGNR